MGKPQAARKAPAERAHGRKKETRKRKGASASTTVVAANVSAPAEKTAPAETAATPTTSNLRASGKRRRRQYNPNAWSASIPTQRTNVLLLGVSYPCVRSQLRAIGEEKNVEIRENLYNPHEESVEQAVELVRRGFLTQMDGRDLGRCLALEAGNDTLAYCVSMENASIYSGRHLKANFNKAKFPGEIVAAWGSGIRFRQVILDYFWIPKGAWVTDHWSRSFFTDTIPSFVTNGLLDFSSGDAETIREGQINASLFEHSTAGFGGGVVYLPFCFHCLKEVIAAQKILFKFYKISFLRKSELAEHALWAATRSISPETMQNWLGKDISQEDKYCTFTKHEFKTSPDEEHVCKSDILKVLKGIEDFDQVRMIKLKALDKYDPDMKDPSKAVLSEKGGFVGLQKKVMRGFGMTTTAKKKRSDAEQPCVPKRSVASATFGGSPVKGRLGVSPKKSLNGSKGGADSQKLKPKRKRAPARSDSAPSSRNKAKEVSRRRKTEEATSTNGACEGTTRDALGTSTDRTDEPGVEGDTAETKRNDEALSEISASPCCGSVQTQPRGEVVSPSPLMVTESDTSVETECELGTECDVGGNNGKALSQVSASSSSCCDDVQTGAKGEAIAPSPVMATESGASADSEGEGEPRVQGDVCGTKEQALAQISGSSVCGDIQTGARGEVISPSPVVTESGISANSEGQPGAEDDIGRCSDKALAQTSASPPLSTFCGDVQIRSGEEMVSPSPVAVTEQEQTLSVTERTKASAASSRSARALVTEADAFECHRLKDPVETDSLVVSSAEEHYSNGVRQELQATAQGSDGSVGSQSSAVAPLSIRSVCREFPHGKVEATTTTVRVSDDGSSCDDSLNGADFENKDVMGTDRVPEESAAAVDEGDNAVYAESFGEHLRKEPDSFVNPDCFSVPRCERSGAKSASCVGRDARLTSHISSTSCIKDNLRDRYDPLSAERQSRQSNGKPSTLRRPSSGDQVTNTEGEVAIARTQTKKGKEGTPTRPWKKRIILCKLQGLPPSPGSLPPDSCSTSSSRSHTERNPSSCRLIPKRSVSSGEKCNSADNFDAGSAEPQDQNEEEGDTPQQDQKEEGGKNYPRDVNSVLSTEVDLDVHRSRSDDMRRAAQALLTFRSTVRLGDLDGEGGGNGLAIVTKNDESTGLSKEADSTRPKGTLFEATEETAPQILSHQMLGETSSSTKKIYHDPSGPCISRNRDSWKPNRELGPKFCEGTNGRGKSTGTSDLEELTESTRDQSFPATDAVRHDGVLPFSGCVENNGSLSNFTATDIGRSGMDTPMEVSLTESQPEDSQGLSLCSTTSSSQRSIQSTFHDQFSYRSASSILHNVRQSGISPTTSLLSAYQPELDSIPVGSQVNEQLQSWLGLRSFHYTYAQEVSYIRNGTAAPSLFNGSAHFSGVNERQYISLLTHQLPIIDEPLLSRDIMRNFTHR